MDKMDKFDAETVDLKGGHHKNQLSYNTSIYMDKLDILNNTIKHIRIIIFINMIALFLYCSRTSIWMSYASTFENSDITTIAFIIWIESTMLGIIGFMFCIFGQKFGYDKCLTVLLLIICMGFIIESISNNFVTLSIGYLISQFSFLIIYITTAYISWLLPFNSAIIYISYNYALFVILSICGPFFSKTIVHYFSFRIAFITNTIIVLLLFIICLIFIFDKQKKIQLSQLEIEQLFEQQQQQYEDDEDDDDKDGNDNIQYRFPIYIQKMDGKLLNDKLFDISLPTKLEWYFLFHYIIQIGFIYALSILYYTYYTQYIMEKYSTKYQHIDVTQLMIGIHLFISTISCIFGIIITRFIILRITYMIERGIIFIGLTIELIIFGFIYEKYDNKLYFNIIWSSIQMFILGSLIIHFEKLLLKLQTYPKESGKINGIKCIITMIFRSVCILLPGLLWNNKESIVGGNQGIWIIMAIIVVIMFLLEMLYTVLKYGSNQHEMKLRQQNMTIISTEYNDK